MHRRATVAFALLSALLLLIVASPALAVLLEDGAIVPSPPTTTISGIDAWKSAVGGDIITLDAVAVTGDALVSTSYQWAGDEAWSVNSAGEGATTLSTTISGFLHAEDHSWDGVRTLRFYSSGTLGGAEAVQEAPVGIDTVAPQTTLGPYEGGWTNQSVTVPIQASDPNVPLASGVLIVHTRRVGSSVPTGDFVYFPLLAVPGAPLLRAAPSPVAPSFLVEARPSHANDGVIVFEVWAEDFAGNVGAPTSATVKIDTIPPVAVAQGWDQDTWYPDPVTVRLSGYDPRPDDGFGQPSGLAALHYRLGDGPEVLYEGPFEVSQAGETTLTFWAVDMAGNASAAQTAVVRVGHPPAIAFMSPPFDHDAPGFMPGIVGPSIFRVRVSDPIDGVASVEAWTTVVTAEDPAVEPPTPVVMKWDADGGEWYGQIPAGLDGHYVLHVRAVDEAGFSSEVSRPFIAGYESGGLEKPLSMDGSSLVRFGAVVPLRLYLYRWGSPVTDKDILPPTLTVVGLHPGLVGGTVVDRTKVRDAGGYTFEYRGNGLWTLNWNSADVATLVAWWAQEQSATVELRVSFGGDSWLTTLLSVKGRR